MDPVVLVQKSSNPTGRQSVKDELVLLASSAQDLQHVLNKFAAACN